MVGWRTLFIFRRYRRRPSSTSPSPKRMNLLVFLFNQIPASATYTCMLHRPEIFHGQDLTTHPASFAVHVSTGVQAELHRGWRVIPRRHVVTAHIQHRLSVGTGEIRDWCAHKHECLILPSRHYTFPKSCAADNKNRTKSNKYTVHSFTVINSSGKNPASIFFC